MSMIDFKKKEDGKDGEIRMGKQLQLFPLEVGGSKRKRIPGRACLTITRDSWKSSNRRRLRMTATHRQRYTTPFWNDSARMWT